MYYLFMKIKGTINQIIYRNSENGYTVLEIFSRGILTTVSGKFPIVGIGEDLELEGEFKYNSNWLKLSFHSKLENVNPYKSSSFDEMFCDCQRVNEQIVRFASRDALAETTTIHYCLATNDCLKAIKDCGIKGLLGLYGTKENPRTSYQIDTLDAENIRNGNIVKNGNIFYAPIDIVLNDTPPERIKSMLDNMKTRKHIWVMIHEQYFYPDYHRYIESYEELLENTFTHLTENGFTSCFYEELL